MEDIKLFYNGKIYLGSKEFGYGFELKNNYFNKIFKNKDEINFDIYKNKIDLDNKLVIPGLIDTHIHMLLAAKNKKNINLSSYKNFEEIKEVISKRIKSEDLKFAFCENLNVDYFLTRDELDQIDNSIPIFIFKSDLHTAFVNTVGLMFLGIYEKNIKSEIGGLIELDKDGFPNGIIRESACQIIRDKISVFNNFESDYTQLKNINDKLIKYGITNVLTCDIFESNEDYIYSLFNKLTNENKTIRINHQVVFYNLDKLKTFLNKHKNEPLNTFNKINDIKIFNDGSLGSKTAYLSSHYLNEEKKYGVKNYDDTKLLEIIRLANSFNKQVAIHSIGDQSSRLCIEVLKKDNLENKNRHKLIHFQLFDKELANDIVNHKILLSVQPCFLEDDLNILEKYVDNKISSYSYRFNEINKLDSNLVSFSTDSPVCSFNPWLNIYYAISGNQLDKIETTNKAFDIYEAIKCYTENGAFSMFEEQIRGKIKELYIADFIVLNQDIFNLENNKDIIKTRVLSSYIDGKKMF